MACPARLLLLLLLLPVATHSTATEFFRAQGDHSLNSLFGLPTPVPPALQRDQSQLLVSLTYANQFAGGADDNELLLLDGERAELRVSWYQALASCLDWGIELPLIAHGEGYFDHAIESWHVFFGLPNGNREQSDPNTLSIVYTDADGQSLTLDSSAVSIGDIHLQLMRPAHCSGASGFFNTLVTRAGVKLPTGATDLLSGSGAADAYLDFSTSDLAPSRALGARLSLGALALGDSDVVSDHQSLVVYGSGVIGWQYSSSLELVTQLDWHSPLFDSELRELGKFASQLAFGGRWRFSSGSVMDFAIQEDVSPDTAPDITLHLGYQRSF